MPNDDVAEVRRIRHEISEECGHDIRKVVAYYREVQDELKRSGEFRLRSSHLPDRRSPKPPPKHQVTSNT